MFSSFSLKRTRTAITATITAATTNSQGAKLTPAAEVAIGAGEGTTDGVTIGVGSEVGMGDAVRAGVGSAEGIGVAVATVTPEVEGTGKDDPGLPDPKYCPPDGDGVLREEAEGGDSTAVGIGVGADVIENVGVGSAEGNGREADSGAKGEYNMAPARRKAKANARTADSTILLLGRLKSQTYPDGYGK